MYPRPGEPTISVSRNSSGSRGLPFFRSLFPNFDTTGNLGFPDGFLEASEYPERDAFPSVFQKQDGENQTTLSHWIKTGMGAFRQVK